MKQQMHNEKSNGQITLISVIAITFILLTTTLSEFFIGYNEYSQSTIDNTADQALEIAESGIENAAYQVIQNNAFTGGTFITPIGSATVSVSVDNTKTPPLATITSSATYSKITRSETATLNLNTPPVVTDKVMFIQNNLYTFNTTINGDTFTNNDLNISSTTFNGNLWAAGKGNGQKNQFSTISVNKVNGSGGTLNAWDPTYLQDGTNIEGDVNYHTALHIDHTSNVEGNQTKQSNGFIPPIANPSFDFSQAQTLATQNGTYYTSGTTFQAYLNSVKTVSGTNATYNLPAGLYFVDCPIVSGACANPFTFLANDGSGNYQQIKGTGVSIVVNSNFLNYGSINITSPYQSGSTYYPTIATNGDCTLFAPVTTPFVPFYTITGLIFVNGTANVYGVSFANPTIINGGIWATNQVNLFDYETVTYNQTYLQNSAGFHFAPSQATVGKWIENP